MVPDPASFERSIREQIAINRARTPTERMQALYDLLEAAHALAPTGPAAEERRRRALAFRERQREEMRALIRKLAAAERGDDSTGV